MRTNMNGPVRAGPGTGALLTARQPDGLISELYQAHALSLVRMARLLLRDQQAAEDVVQDVFLNLHRALPRLRDRDQMLPYLRTCVANGCRSAQRSAQRRRLRALRWPVLHERAADSAESAALITEQRREVLDAVARLPRRAREVLVLRYYLDLPATEIAATLGVSESTVRSTASRALAALSRELKGES
jgi:RNA polymerase sigma-70 factor (sigma-E family)